MEALLIVGIIGALGVSLSNQKQEKEQYITNTNTDPLKSRRGNSSNMYHANEVSAINDALLETATTRYIESRDSGKSGIIPPLYNATTFNRVDNTEYYNKVQVPIKTKKVDINSRPAFKSTLVNGAENGSDIPANFSNFGTDPVHSQTSYIDDKSTSIERFSLLSGQPLEQTHSNMNPFFGSNIKQSTVPNANESILDVYSGVRPNGVASKMEIAPMFAQVNQDINGTPNYTDTISTDRYSASIYRQGEKPFQEQRVAAPIARTYDNPITIAQSDYRTIDEFRVKDKITYDGRVIAGQIGTTRGIQGEVNKNKPDTYFKNDAFFTNATLEKSTIRSDIVFKDTARQSQNMEYIGGAYTHVHQGSVTKSEYEDTKRQQLATDTIRNATGATRALSNTESYNLPELERNSANSSVILNASYTGSHAVLQDGAQTTGRETLDDVNNDNLNIKTTFDQGSAEAYSLGINNVDAKTTQKEMYVKSDYFGTPTTNDGMGYNTFNPDIKTTHRQINVQDPRTSGMPFLNLNSGTGVVGGVKHTPNMQLKERENDHNGHVLSNNMPTHNAMDIGASTSIRNSATDYENTRFNGDDIRFQLKDNVYALHR